MVSLRSRIVLTLLPLFAIIAMMGAYGAVLIHRIGGRIDQILHENYASVLYMERLKENLERMDSAFQFALAGREQDARKQFDENWQLYNRHLAEERRNITLPGEGELVAELTSTGDRYRQQGNAFFAENDPAGRRDQYFGIEQTTGLLEQFKRMKNLANEITILNQTNMEQANADAKRTAESSLAWFTVSLLAVIALATLLARRTITTIVRPIESVTHSVEAIGAGNLNQVIAQPSSQELAQLVTAVNTMARQLRDYRQTQQARLVRSQQAARATIDSFPDPVVLVDSDGQVEMANPAARNIFGLGEPVTATP
ncbi:MAG TPA: HAMP domain-containing protein, partial [Pirellulales bacterium]|nr:HAMP domain-containing protein [Pirellulales bacterium]